MIKFTCERGMGQKRTKEVTERHSTRERLSTYRQRINKYLHLPFEEALHKSAAIPLILEAIKKMPQLKRQMMLLQSDWRKNELMIYAVK